MQVFFEVVIILLAAWFIWSPIWKMSVPERLHEPFAEVPAPIKRGPKGLTGAVALEEPRDDDSSNAFHRAACNRYI